MIARWEVLVGLEAYKGFLTRLTLRDVGGYGFRCMHIDLDGFRFVYIDLH